MTSWQNSALWALISFPIAGIALIFSFAVAHGSLFLLALLNTPALITLELISNGHVTTLDITAALLIQYVCYFLTISLIKIVFLKLKR